MESLYGAVSDNGGNNKEKTLDIRKYSWKRKILDYEEKFKNDINYLVDGIKSEYDQLYKHGTVGEYIMKIDDRAKRKPKKEVNQPKTVKDWIKRKKQ